MKTLLVTGSSGLIGSEVCIYFSGLESLLGIILAFGAWFGSILVSYVRARAEGLQITCNVGLMQRPERIILLGIGVLLQGVLWYKFSIGSKYRNGATLHTRYPHTYFTHNRGSPSHLFVSRIGTLTKSEKRFNI